MNTVEISAALAGLFTELVAGTGDPGGPFILNTGNEGLLRAIDRLTARDASSSANDGATIAAHVQHLRCGLSLMNRWAAEGGDPFADPKWDEAWKVSAVDDEQWAEIRAGLREQAQRWLQVLEAPRQLSNAELNGMIGSIAQVAYHLGAIRQINKARTAERRQFFPFSALAAKGDFSRSVRRVVRDRLDVFDPLA